MVDDGYCISQTQTGCLPDHLDHRQLAESCMGKNHSISVGNRASSGIYLPAVWAALGLQTTERTAVGFHTEYLTTGRIGASFFIGHASFPRGDAASLCFALCKCIIAVFSLFRSPGRRLFDYSCNNQINCENTFGLC